MPRRYFAVQTHVGWGLIAAVSKRSMLPRKWLAMARVVLFASALGVPQAFAQTGDSGYVEPDFSVPIFDIDSVFLVPAEIREVTGALAALAANFPTNPKIDAGMRARALAVALRLDGLHLHARATNDSLKAAEVPTPVEGYESPQQISVLLWSLAETLDTPDASMDDHRLACYLMDIAARIDPSYEGGLARFQDLMVKGDYKGWRGVVAGARSFDFNAGAVNGAGTEGGTTGATDPTAAVPPVSDLPPSVLQKEVAMGSTLVLDILKKPWSGRAAGLEARAVVGTLQSPMALRFQDSFGNPLAAMDPVVGVLPGALLTGGSAWPANGGSITLSVDGAYEAPNGESLALPSALLVQSLISGKEIEPGLVALGGVAADGKLLPAEHLLPRLRRLPAAQAPLLLLPHASTSSLTDIALIGDLQLLLRHQIFVADHLSQAIPLAFDHSEDLKRARSLFEAVQELSNTMSATDLAANSQVQKQLTEVLELAPSHASARLILAAGNQSLPERLSLTGSVYALEQVGAPVIEVMSADRTMLKLRSDLKFGGSKSAISNIRAKLSPPAVEAADTLRSLIDSLESYSALQNKTSERGSAQFSEVEQAWTKLSEQYRGLRSAGAEGGGAGKPSSPPLDE